MLEKVIKYGLPLIGVCTGTSLGLMSAQACNDPAVIGVAKSVGMGIIFAAAGYNAQETINKYVKEQLKGGDK